VVRLRPLGELVEFVKVKCLETAHRSSVSFGPDCPWLITDD
jgi:hypothetical protein